MGCYATGSLAAGGTAGDGQSGNATADPPERVLIRLWPTGQPEVFETTPDDLGQGTGGSGGGGGSSGFNSLDRFTPLHSQPARDIGVGLASLAVQQGHLVMEFDVNENVYFASVMNRNYIATGNGIDTTICWTAAATTGTVTWDAAFERHAAGVTNLALAAGNFAAAQSIVAVAPTTSNTPVYTTITFATGNQVDGLQPGESYRLRVGVTAKTMSGSPQMLRVELTNA
jgi:hypothetical protein